MGASDAVIAVLLPLLLTTSSVGARTTGGGMAVTPAADSARVVLVLPEVRVERERALSAARLRLPTAFVTDLAADSSGRALETLSEVLAGAAGVRVQQYGGLGAFSTVSLRGAPPGQVAVYLDGAPLTSAARGVVNLADLPVTAVERVEVYRGVSPLELGAAAPGGAINLVTASSPDLRQLSLARGSFGTWEGRGTLGARRGRLSAMAHAGYQRTRGDFLYADGNGTPLNPEDDEISRRVNNRFDAATALLTLACAVRPGLRLRARGDLFHKAQGLPGLDAVPAYHARLSLLRSLSQLELEQQAGRRYPGVHLQLSLGREASRFREPDARLGLGNHDTHDRFGDERYSITLTSPALPLGATLRGSGAARFERARLSDRAIAAPDPPESRRRTLGASAGVHLHPLGDWLTLHAAQRWDRLTDALRSNVLGGTVLRSDVVREIHSPQAGVRIAPGHGVEVRANWTDASRAPDFLELFGNQGSVHGNPGLRPERAVLWDVGGAWSGVLKRGERCAVEWAHYESRARDLIVYARTSPSAVSADNISRARIRGEELSLRLATPAGLSLAGAFTWQTTLDQGDAPAWRGCRLPQRSEHQGWARVDAVLGRVRAAADLQFIGDYFRDRANDERAPARTLVGVSLSTSPLPGVRLTIEGKNLGDVPAADVGGFPLPGRCVFASCRLALGGAGTRTP